VSQNDAESGLAVIACSLNTMYSCRHNSLGLSRYISMTTFGRGAIAVTTSRWVALDRNCSFPTFDRPGCGRLGWLRQLRSVQFDGRSAVFACSRHAIARREPGQRRRRDRWAGGLDIGGHVWLVTHCQSQNINRHSLVAALVIVARIPKMAKRLVHTVALGRLKSEEIEPSRELLQRVAEWTDRILGYNHQNVPMFVAMTAHGRILSYRPQFASVNPVVRTLARARCPTSPDIYRTMDPVR
jgi:hypothetical protein